MTCGRAVVERAGELRRSGLSCREMARELDGPSKGAVARRTRAEGGTVGRAVARMGLPKSVGDGPARPGIDPDDKHALMERLVLENVVLGAANGVFKAASLDGLSNGGKTPVMDRLGPCGKWPLRELASSLGISEGPHGCQRRAIARPDRPAPPRALVRRAFAGDGEGARGHRFVARELRGLGVPVRASERVVPRIMRGEGPVPRWTRGKRGPHGSHAGGPRPAPPDLARRDSRSAPPNFPRPTDVTEFGPPPRQGGLPVGRQGPPRPLGRGVEGRRAPGRRAGQLDARGRLRPADARRAPRHPLRPRRPPPLARPGLDLREQRPHQEHARQGLQPGQRRAGKGRVTVHIIVRSPLPRASPCRNPGTYRSSGYRVAVVQGAAGMIAVILVSLVRVIGGHIFACGL